MRNILRNERHMLFVIELYFNVNLQNAETGSLMNKRVSAPAGIFFSRERKKLTLAVYRLQVSLRFSIMITNVAMFVREILVVTAIEPPCIHCVIKL